MKLNNFLFFLFVYYCHNKYLYYIKTNNQITIILWQVSNVYIHNNLSQKQMIKSFKTRSHIDLVRFQPEK